MERCFSWYISFVAYFNSTRSGKMRKTFRIIELVLGILIIIATSVLYFMDIISGGASGIISAVGMGIFIHADNLSKKNKTE